MKRNTGLLLLSGATAYALISSISSSIATPVREQFQLTTGQKEFIKQFDYALGTKILPLASSPAGAPFVKVAMIACGDNQLQRDTLFSLGATEWQAKDAINRFESLFCNGETLLGRHQN